MNRKRVLFVCIHNSARSQMAEELLRRLAPDQFEVESAGIKPGKLNPIVVSVLKAEGIYIEGKQTKSVKDLIEANILFDYVITVCDETSAERCPVFPGVHNRIHWDFPDPSQFQGSDEEKIEKTMEVKERIRNQIMDWLSSLGIHQ